MDNQTKQTTAKSMTLQNKLQIIAEASAKQIPQDAQAIMKRSTQSVADSIGHRAIPQIGEMLPEFELPDSTGRIVASAVLAQQGPLVLSFFRGKW